MSPELSPPYTGGESAAKALTRRASNHDFRPAVLAAAAAANAVNLLLQAADKRQSQSSCMADQRSGTSASAGNRTAQHVDFRDAGSSCCSMPGFNASAWRWQIQCAQPRDRCSGVPRKAPSKLWTAGHALPSQATLQSQAWLPQTFCGLDVNEAGFSIAPPRPCRSLGACQQSVQCGQCHMLRDPSRVPHSFHFLPSLWAYSCFSSYCSTWLCEHVQHFVSLRCWMGTMPG